eukprot:3186520-Rhodomonas_salina.2
MCWSSPFPLKSGRLSCCDAVARTAAAAVCAAMPIRVTTSCCRTLARQADSEPMSLIASPPARSAHCVITWMQSLSCPLRKSTYARATS